MYVPGWSTKNVFFVMERRRKGGADGLHPIATGFFIGYAEPGEAIRLCYFITAQHAIQKSNGNEVYLRFNRRSGGYVDVPIDRNSWYMSNASDVAAHMAHIGGDSLISAMEDADVKIVDCTRFVGGGPDYEFVLHEGKLRQRFQIQLGDELFAMSLFTISHARDGGEILPVARFGKVSRLPELINTPRWEGDKLRSPAYLAEFLSWGGISGAPVFWHTQALVGNRYRTVTGLLGMVNGHFDIPRKPEVTGDVLGEILVKSNAGIAYITPACAIIDLLHSENATEDRLKAVAEIKTHREPPPTLDVSSATDCKP